MCRGGIWCVPDALGVSFNSIPVAAAKGVGVAALNSPHFTTKT
jgi:hypothetical protein